MTNLEETEYGKPMLRFGVSIEDLKIPESAEDLKKMQDSNDDKNIIGGYGFTKDQYVYIPNLPNWDEDPKKRKLLIKMPNKSGSEHSHWIVGITRFKKLSSGKYRASKTYLNVNRLYERSFVDQTPVDDFRERMVQDFEDKLDGVEALSGHLLKTTDEVKEIKAFVFTDGEREKNPDGSWKETLEKRYVVEDLGVVDINKLPFEVAE